MSVDKNLPIVQAALWQRDLAAALAELERPEHPRASWRPLLESMARSRSRPVLVDALTVLPPGGPARVVVRGHEPGEVVLLDDQLVEVDRLDLDQQLRLVPGLPWAVAEDDEHAVLLDLLHGRTLGVGRPQLHHLAPFDVTGHPAMSVPCAMSDGLPVGMMLIGRRYDEATVLRAAHAFEQAGPWNA